MLIRCAATPDTILQNLKTHPLVEISDHCIRSREELIAFCRSLGELLAWDFGYINELKYDPNSQNYLYSNEAVPFHWDGAFAISPYLLVFHCLKAPAKGSGGHTLFTNGTALLKDCSVEYFSFLSNLELVYQTEKKAHYGGVAKTSCISRHPINHQPILRYAEPVVTQKNPVSLTVPTLSLERQKALEKFMVEKLYHPDYCYTHVWQDNQLIIADNFTLLHARHAFSPPYDRHLRRVQVLTSKEIK